MKYRRIKRNHSCQQPQRIVFLDCETIKVTDYRPGYAYSHHYRLSCCEYWRRDKDRWIKTESTRWKNRHQMWEYVFSKARKNNIVTVFAHNAVFDLTVSDFWSYLDGGEFILSGDVEYHCGREAEVDDKRAKWKGMLVADDRRLIVSGACRSGRVEIFDSMNYYRESLASIGESIGIAKMKLPDESESDEIWYRYCENDVSILSNAMIGLMNEWSKNDYGNWQPTIASLAWSNYRHKYISEDIQSHNDKIAKTLERSSHYGGECRAFFIGDIIDDYEAKLVDFTGEYLGHRPYIVGPVHLLDVRSLYPWVMYTAQLPIRHVVSKERSTIETLSKLVDRYWCIADVFIASNKDRYPKRIRSARDNRAEDRLVFPTGEYETTLCGVELLDAVKRGSVIGVGYVAAYSTASIFKEYVNHWWSERKAAEASGNIVRAKLCKNMLNTLYGRFAMGGKQWVLTDGIYPEVQWGTFLAVDCDADTYTECRAVGGNVFVEREAIGDGFSLSSIACCITAMGRYMMRTIRGMMPFQSVIYQDTDSLMVTDEGYKWLTENTSLIGDDIGQLTLKATYQSVRLFGQRNYTADGQHCIAGLPKDRLGLGNRKFECEVWERSESLLTRSCPDTVGVMRKDMDFSRNAGGDIAGRYGWTMPMLLSECWTRKA